VLHLYFKKDRGTQGSVAAFLQDSPSKIFFLRVVSRKKEEKLITDKLPTRRVQDSLLSFLSNESLNSRKAKDFFADELHIRATFRVP
jgi:hypothetical protein